MNGIDAQVTQQSYKCSGSSAASATLPDFPLGLCCWSSTSQYALARMKVNRALWREVVQLGGWEIQHPNISFDINDGVHQCPTGIQVWLTYVYKGLRSRLQM